MYKTELHVHTRYSPDSLLSLSLLHLTCRIRGIHCIAITDHNEIAGAVAFKKKYARMSVIIGEEVFTSEGEIIGLFLKERIPSGLSCAETIRRIREQNGLVYVPHPYDRKRQKTALPPGVVESLRHQIEYMEAYNGRTVNAEDLQLQSKTVDAYGFSPVVGSDAHTWLEIGRNYHVTREPIEDCESFKRLIPDSQLVTAPCIRFAHYITMFAKAVYLLKTGQFSILREKAVCKIRKN